VTLRDATQSDIAAIVRVLIETKEESIPGLIAYWAFWAAMPWDTPREFEIEHAGEW
jgi:hypothetical protein